MSDAGWQHWKFGLIVTGEAEEQALPQLFRTLAATGLCSFKVIRRVGQLDPKTSKKAKPRMVGVRKPLPTKAEERIGLPAMRYIMKDSGHYIIVIDDLEWGRHDKADLVFQRYCGALDHVIKNQEHRSRASVHFLAMMMEAYFFADSQAVNSVVDVGLADHNGDVEEIRQPKGRLADLISDKTGIKYNEVEHGAEMLKRVNVEHVLSHPECCAYLRSLMAWCVRKLETHPGYTHVELLPDFQIQDGVKAEVTDNQ